MLNTVQIKELKKKKFYSSTYRILYNVQYYSDLKTNFSFSFITKISALATIFKFIFCLFGIFNIKKFAKFRNENIERVLNYDITSKSVIHQLESNKWLDTTKNDFKEKMRAIKTSTDALYAEPEFINEIQEVLKNPSSFNPNRLEEIFNMLLEDYETIIEAWKDCQGKEKLAIKHVKEKYYEIKESNINSEKLLFNMTNGQLTQNFEEIIKIFNKQI